MPTHLGVILDHPMIDCVKSILFGQYAEPDDSFGANISLVHKGDVIGTDVRTRVGYAPSYVSPGHKFS